MDSEEDFNLTGARAIKLQAAAWLERQDHADWNDKDQTELDLWLAESTENYLFYHRVASAWDRSRRLIALRRPEEKAAVKTNRNRRRPLLRVALVASAVLAVLVAGIEFLASSSQTRTFVTPIGGHEIVTLGDGSVVELNTDTTIRTEIGPNYRMASIEKGEAFFKIAHDVSHPFTITANNNKITVLGTQFSVRNEPNRVEVRLVEGKVWFTSGEGDGLPKSALMASGDVLIATASVLSVAKRAPIELTNDLGWRRGLLVFHHSSLANAVREYNRYNDHKLIIANAEVEKLTVTGSLPAHDTREFLTIAQKFFGLHVQKVGDETVISR
jgi:transmembrane sensor